VSSQSSPLQQSQSQPPSQLAGFISAQAPAQISHTTITSVVTAPTITVPVVTIPTVPIVTIPTVPTAITTISAPLSAPNKVEQRTIILNEDLAHINKSDQDTTKPNIIQSIEQKKGN